MIDSGRRLVVFAEVQGPPPDWYMQGWEQVQDTSFSVGCARAFTCALNRGSTGNSLSSSTTGFRSQFLASRMPRW